MNTAVTAPEFQLAVETCRWSFAGEGEERIERIAAGVDWLLFLRVARRHRVEALAWNCLGKLGLIPDPRTRAELSADAAAIATKNLLIARECAALRDGFARAGVSLLFLKGLTVGALAYPDPFLKTGWDIDVLVSADEVDKAAVLLEALGYLPVEPASRARLRDWHRVSKESVWLKPDGDFHLELHSRLADNAWMIPDVGMNSPRQRVEIAPTIVLPTLAHHHLFAYLCVHGASSAWFRLKWISDLAGLLHRCSDGDIDALYRSAIALGAGRSADQALLLASHLFGTIRGSDLEARIRHDPLSRWLARAAFRQLAALPEPTQRPLGTATIHLTQFALIPGLGFKISELLRQARHVLLRFRT